MKITFIILSLNFILFFEAAASQQQYPDYFKRVPIEKAHVTSGKAYDLDFDSQLIKVLVWNIKKASESEWEREFLNYAENKDLFILQEAYPDELFKRTIFSFENVRWDMGISFLYRLYNDLPTGTMIGSKVQPMEFLVKHSFDLEPITKTPKAMTFAKFPIEGTDKLLLVINVHGINFTGHDAFERHMEQAEVEILKHVGPIIFAGDFNTRTRERMTFLFNLTKRLGLKEVKFKNGHKRMVAKFTNYILDHGFVRGLEVVNAEVIADSEGSDHKPMELEVSLENR